MGGCQCLRINAYIEILRASLKVKHREAQQMKIGLTPPPFAAAQTQPRLTWVASLQLIGHRPVGDLVFLVVLVVPS